MAIDVARRGARSSLRFSGLHRNDLEPEHLAFIGSSTTPAITC